MLSDRWRYSPEQLFGKDSEVVPSESGGYKTGVTLTISTPRAATVDRNIIVDDGNGNQYHQVVTAGTGEHTANIDLWYHDAYHPSLDPSGAGPIRQLRQIMVADCDYSGGSHFVCFWYDAWNPEQDRTIFGGDPKGNDDQLALLDGFAARLREGDRRPAHNLGSFNPNYRPPAAIPNDTQVRYIGADAFVPGEFDLAHGTLGVVVEYDVTVSESYGVQFDGVDKVLYTAEIELEVVG